MDPTPKNRPTNNWFRFLVYSAILMYMKTTEELIELLTVYRSMIVTALDKNHPDGRTQWIKHQGYYSCHPRRACMQCCNHFGRPMTFVCNFALFDVLSDAYGMRANMPWQGNSDYMQFRAILAESVPLFNALLELQVKKKRVFTEKQLRAAIEPVLLLISLSR